MGKSQNDNAERLTRIERLLEQLNVETTELKRLTAVAGEKPQLEKIAKRARRKKR